ncbi:MAG: hypothetical protein WDN27_03975 [Candidatus Saccharibacteria bacterium]
MAIKIGFQEIALNINRDLELTAQELYDSPNKKFREEPYDLVMSRLADELDPDNDLVRTEFFRVFHITDDDLKFVREAKPGADEPIVVSKQTACTVACDFTLVLICRLLGILRDQLCMPMLRNTYGPARA